MKYPLNNANLKQRRRELRQNQSDAERLFWSHIRNKQFLGYKFFRQYSIGNYIVDFYCPALKLAIELDGGQHNNDVIKEYDFERTKYLNDYGIEVMRFWNNEILLNIEGVLEVLYRKIVNKAKLNPT